jgi:hypothetical protein
MAKIDKTEKSCHIFVQYSNLMNEYLMHFSQSTKYMKNDKDNNYLLLNGLATLTHVFNVILHTTMDSVLALENVQKSIYYYTQFIDQIEENSLNDLNISSTSASLFVYNKTIDGVEKMAGVAVAEKQSPILEAGVKEQSPLIEAGLKGQSPLIEAGLKGQSPLIEAGLKGQSPLPNAGLYRTIIELFIVNNVPINSIVIKMQYIMKELCTNENDMNFLEELLNVKLFIHHLIGKRLSGETIYEIIYLYIKKYKHIGLNTVSLCKKMACMDERLDEVNVDKKKVAVYVKWVIDA